MDLNKYLGRDFCQIGVVKKSFDIPQFTWF